MAKQSTPTTLDSYPNYCLCIGRKIASLRKQLGLSQQDLANLSNISPSYVAKIECATGTLGTSLQVLYILAKVLNVQMDELFRIEPNDVFRVSVFLRKMEIRKSKKK